MEFDPALVGQRIKRLRLGKNLTQLGLGTLLKVNQDVVSRWERGKQLPALKRRKQLAEALETDFESLFFNLPDRLAAADEMSLDHMMGVLRSKGLKGTEARRDSMAKALRAKRALEEQNAAAVDSEIVQRMRGGRERIARRVAALRAALEKPE